MTTKKTAGRVYRDGGKMTPSKNLLESKKLSVKKAKKRSNKAPSTTHVNTRTMKKMVAASLVPKEIEKPIIFDGAMRKVFTEGVLQDIKGYFENKAEGLVEITYQDHEVKRREFGFKLIVEKTSNCTKQKWSEVSSAIVNIINYMFPMDSIGSDLLDVVISSNNNKLELQLISCW